jgi:hypothetical protein
MDNTTYKFTMSELKTVSTKSYVKNIPGTSHWVKTEDDSRTVCGLPIRDTWVSGGKTGGTITINAKERGLLSFNFGGTICTVDSEITCQKCKEAMVVSAIHFSQERGDL